MKAIIKVCTAEKEFTQEQVKFMKRMACCLIQHHQLAVVIKMKIKKVKHLKIKVS
ncbi:MAG TPA: hypothetical protein VMV77_02300 [Bacteroidales bacterium]|nr:hypothetical protein [Bacteroidales bacterium]